LFIENNVAPAPTQLNSSSHAIPGASLYDIEFGGFTKLLTRETSTALAPGVYSVKIVVQDVQDRRVDAAVFIEEDSLKLFAFKFCDLNRDGVVNTADKNIIDTNFGDPDPTYWDGDVNQDGEIDAADSVMWTTFNGQTGNADLSADFNRDGCVDNDDRQIVELYHCLPHCASRFEGDADGDGDVDENDDGIYTAQVGMGACGP
jgi:hypothetical protein